MREIKFKAWDRRRSLMLDTWVMDFRASKEYIMVQMECVTKRAPTLVHSWGNTIEHVILLQFTGLKDSNGKDIYEGDILSGHSDGNVTVRWAENAGHWECAFNDEASIGIDEMCVWFGNTSQIIGNIYENPELLS